MLKKIKGFNNLLNNTSIPFILPKSNDEDIGSNITKNYLPALEKSFKNSFPISSDPNLFPFFSVAIAFNISFLFVNLSIFSYLFLNLFML